ncbi:DUF2057 family protein [Marinomonas atlantica]|uniref:DUF2057 family protein n=1 Tax=Marinomonas atlantica TaxID=1806668 RepID=UPI0008375323|nr:DUF2057 family protein [Marinomonas atlantica]MCO4786822.1 DUF2057 family protein [Marinomonas atlantica]
MKNWKYWLLSTAVIVAPLTQAGALYVDKEIELLALDGKVIDALNTTPRDLKSGDHQFVFRYKNRVQDGGREVEFKTPPLLMNLNTLANDEIEILAPQLNTKSQAELYFSNRTVWRVKYANGSIKTINYDPLTEKDLPKEAIQNVLDQYNKAQENTFQQTLEPDESSSDLLTSIQLLYLQANQEQRDEIKEWIIKQ